MITNEEKIKIIQDRINNIDEAIKSFILNEEKCAGKYSLEDEISLCNRKKNTLINLLESFKST